MDDDLQRMLERHEAFWRGEGTRPLKRVCAHVPLEERGHLPLAGGRRAADGQHITPEMIDPRRFFEGDRRPASPLNGEFMAGSVPPALCWTEAILGCPVRVVTGGPWADPFFEEGGDPDGLRLNERWLSKLDEFVDYLVKRADGRYPVGQPLFRGPVDMMAAALGHEPMCVGLLESPEWSDAFLRVCADAFIRVAKRRLARTPPFAGGYLSADGIWAPGWVVRTQADNAALLSPKVYRERVLPQDRRVIEAFDFPLIHLHSSCLHVVDDLLRVEALKAIQVSIDFPGGPLAHDVLPTLENIIQVKPLIVTGPVTVEELGALEALSPPGRLCLQVEVLPDHR